MLCSCNVIVIFSPPSLPLHFTLYYYVGHFLPPLSRNWAHPQVAFFASILKPYSQYHGRNLILKSKLKNARINTYFKSQNLKFPKDFHEVLKCFKNWIFKPKISWKFWLENWSTRFSINRFLWMYSPHPVWSNKKS